MDDDSAHDNGDGVATNGVAHEADEAQCCNQPSGGDVDVGETGRRKRIDAILQSKSFRDELDRLLGSGVIDDNSVAGCLEQLTSMVGRLKREAGRATDGVKGYQCVRPVCDLRGVEGTQFSTYEKALRCKFACVFRLVDALGWNDACGSHLVLALPEGEPSVLVNPCDLLYSQMSASTLLRVPLSALGQSAGALPPELGRLHAPLLRAGASCVLHVRHEAVSAVSALRCGLLPVNEFAGALGPVEQLSGSEQLPDWGQRHFSSGNRTGVVLINNCGALCCADSVERTFFLMVNLVVACETQLNVMPMGVDNLCLLDECEQRRCREEWNRVFSSGAGDCELQFEAGVRLLERSGCRTGNAYQLPHLSALTSLQALTGVDRVTDQVTASPSRKSTVSRAGERIRWLGQQTAESKV